MNDDANANTMIIDNVEFDVYSPVMFDTYLHVHHPLLANAFDCACVTLSETIDDDAEEGDDTIDFVFVASLRAPHHEELQSHDALGNELDVEGMRNAIDAYNAYVNETPTLTSLWVLTCTHATSDCDFDAIDHAFMTSADLARRIMNANNIPTE